MAQMTKFPACWDEVQQKINNLVHETKYFHENKQMTSFVLVRNGLCGEIYKIFVNDGDPELTAFMEAHEIGHIIYGHVKNNSIKNAINKIKVKAAYNKVQQHFSNADDFYTYFERMLNNIVLDMEVNGKLFTEEEQDFRELHKARLFNGTDEHTMNCWAPAYGFPNGLDANAYLTLILADPEKFFEKLKDQMNGQDGEGQQGEGEGEGQGSGDGDGSSNSNGGSGSPKGKGKSKVGSKSKKGAGSDGSEKNQNWKFSKEELQKLMQEIEQLDQSEEMKKSEAEMNKMLNQSHTEGRSEEGEANSQFAGVTSDSRKLEKMLTDMLIREQTQTKRNMMYYYNRRKFGTSMLIPKTTRESNFERPRLYILVDVSGSINQTTLSMFAGLFDNIATKLNNKCRFITWDTRLEGDWLVKDIPEYLNAGGGTSMAGGFKYIAETYHPRNKDAVVIVSDYEDNVNDWIRMLDKYNLHNVYGVLWTNDGYDDDYYWRDTDILKKIKTTKFLLSDFS